MYLHTYNMMIMTVIVSHWSFHDNLQHHQGLFSRITFSQPVYLGGKGAIRNVKHFLQMEQGVCMFFSSNFSRFYLMTSFLWCWVRWCQRWQDDGFHLETITQLHLWDTSSIDIHLQADTILAMMNQNDLRKAPKNVILWESYIPYTHIPIFYF